MIIAMFFDYFGDAKGLKEWDDAWKKACSETSGIKYNGRYTSHQARYHWTHFFETDSYDKFLEAMGKIKLVRDRSILTHAVIEIFQGPFYT
jgi:hypothetical protein